MKSSTSLHHLTDLTVYVFVVYFVTEEFHQGW
jgi:hypothetical protein